MGPHHKSATLVGIGGGSGSGKSWLAKYLKRRLGAKAVVVCQDWYYRHNGHLTPAQARRLNFDHPRAIDMPLLLLHLDRLIRCRPIDAPRYDYATHSRLPRARRVEPAPVIILEGLFALVESRLRKRYDFSVYIDVPDDIRLIRRVRRDVEARRVDLEETLRLYEHCVRPMHERFIGPSSARAEQVWRQSEDRLFPRRLLRAIKRRLG